MAKYIEYSYNDPEYLVVGDLLSKNGEPLLREYGGESKEFLDYKGDTDKTNRQRILAQLEESEDYSSTYDDDLPLVIPTTLLIPKSKLKTFSNNELFALNNIDEGDDGNKFTVFVNDIQKRLSNNPNYKTLKKSGRQGNFIDFYPQITVWIWSRVLDKVINVSPFIYACSTNSGDNTTTFQISLPPVLAKKSGDKWEIDSSTVEKLGNQFNVRSTLFKTNTFEENNFYFNKVISQNDLIFIQYETLELEKNQRERDALKFTIPYAELAKDRIYDVIGSIDNVSLISNPAAAEIGIQISGRDLSKFLIDDGTYFFYEELLGNLFPDKKENKKLRNRVYGKIPELNALGFRSIEDQIQTILRLYYVTGYYPDYIFKNWKNRNTDLVRDTENLDNFKEALEAQKDYCLSQIKISRDFYNLSNSEGEDLKAEQIFNTINSLIDLDLLIETSSGNTFLSSEAQNQLSGELYYASNITSQVVEENTFGAAISACRDYKNSLESLPESPITSNPREGIWQIFDIEIDPSVSDLRVYDSKLNEANGSILSSLQAIAEEPFVEIFSDTYGDRFKLIARRQPFNAKYYNELKRETVIDIEPEEVISTTLDFNSDEIYTWFYLQPVGLTFSEKTFVAYPSAFILEDYVNIWGSKPYNKTTNYVPFIKKQDIDAQINTDLKRAVNDLKYMIDINAYLPFVRSGTIVINGDRTIKKKQAIRLKQTGEIFHVDTVQNSFAKGQSIDRTTVLQVSRGMVEKYMNPNNEFSYFNIVNTEIKQADLNTNGKDSDFAYKITQNWGVNSDVFKFFLNRKQFLPRGYSQKLKFLG